MNKLSVVTVVAIASLAGVASADISFTGSTLTENFDSLPTATTSSAVGAGWSNNSTLPGWFSNQTSLFRVDNGTNNNGALYSFGDITSPTASTERALGATAGGSGAAGTGTAFNGVTYAAAISNDSGNAMSDFTVTYDGEQWRNGGNATAQSILFSYQIFPAGTTDAQIATAITGAGWTSVSALNFTSPVASTTAGALNGNLAANRIAGITSTVTTTWNAGDILVIRWADANDTGNDHGLAIDNLSFSATPTPGAAALLGLGALAVGRRRRA